MDVPRYRDVVVESQTVDGRVVFVLRPATGAGQYVAETREEAIAQAIRFARRLGIHAWFTKDGRTFMRLDDAGHEERPKQRERTAS